MPANKKGSDLSALSSPNLLDILIGIDVSDVTDGPAGSSKGLLLSALLTFILANTTVAGLPAGMVVTEAEGLNSSDNDTSVPTTAAVKDYVDTGGLMTTAKYAPRGFLINGKLAVTVSSNNITVALKGMDGNNPSASNVVYCRIGDTVRSITAALSVTKAAGTNWFNSGAAELAAQEIDYFAYLGYNSTDGVTIGFARIPFAKKYDDFSATTTNDQYCAISTITTASGNDPYENIGRFAATLSASSSYLWTVPTYTPLNLIQRAIEYTRWLAFNAVHGGGYSADPTGGTFKYRIFENQANVDVYQAGSGTSNGTTCTLLAPITSGAANGGMAAANVFSGGSHVYAYTRIDASSNVINAYAGAADGAFSGSSDKGIRNTNIFYPLQ